MSRWGSDPDGAADQLIRRSLDEIGVQGRTLLAYASPELPSVLAQQGFEVTTWNRRCAGTQAAAAWPTPGPYDLALLRLPKAKDEQEMAAHATLSVLDDTGHLVVYGGNDEGIRSAGRQLAALCGSVDTLAVRGHGRVLSVRPPADASRLRTPLSAWRSTTPLPLGGTLRNWAYYPGIFAGGRIDDGTALLLATLPPLAAGARVLDYGCGSGLIAAAALAQQPGLALDLLDSDAVALEAARENVPDARTILGTRVTDVGNVTYDAILSNPPLHTGLAEDHAHLEALVRDASGHLKPGGLLQMVVQRRLPLDRLLAQHFAGAVIVAETTRYRIWRANDGLRRALATATENSAPGPAARRHRRRPRPGCA